VTALLKKLDWDSEFFGVSIARVIPATLTDSDLLQIHAECEKSRYACLYALVDGEVSATVHALEKDAFQLMDIRMTLTRKSSDEPRVRSTGDVVIRPSSERDIESLRAIARVSHVDSRYYADSNFPRSRCDDLYALWIEKSCRDYADVVLVAEWNGKSVGYITCDANEDHVGQIGLFAVNASAQGRGIGRRLIQESLAWFQSQGCDRVDVVTQGCNVRAQQAYQKAGFVTSRVQLWFHKWFQSQSK
jgi:dTDP-4-amino-4,6-dideoxy-D-galactose acyltransferase